MHGRRVLLLGLDGFDVVLAERFAREGLLPNFARLRAEGAGFDIDDGREKIYRPRLGTVPTSGIRPNDGGRWSSVTFHKFTYQATQDSTIVRPLLADLAIKGIALDVPHFDLSRAPNICGLTTWGPHEPGAPPASRPSGLDREMIARFGKYPAADWLYGFCWPAPQRAQATVKLSHRLWRCVRALRGGCSRSVSPIGISVSSSSAKATLRLKRCGSA